MQHFANFDNSEFFANVVESQCSAVTGARQKDAHAVVRHGLDPPLVIDLGQRMPLAIQPMRDRNQPHEVSDILLQLLFVHRKIIPRHPRARESRRSSPRVF